MTLSEFHHSLVLPSPPTILNALLKALWLDAKGDWQKSHELVQDLEMKEAAWIHAYLHRKEGDESNARYWYSRAGKIFPKVDVKREWKDIVEELLSRQ